MKLIQPIAVAACALMLISAPAPQPVLHAGAPETGGRAARKDDAELWTDVQQWMQANCGNRWAAFGTISNWPIGPGQAAAREESG